MKAHELARQLLEGPDVDVLVATDEEGNDFNPLVQYTEEMGWKRHVQKFSGGYDEFVLSHPRDQDEYEDDEWAERQPFVVIWP